MSVDAVSLVKPAGVFRRIAAVCYDCLPVLALTVVATFPFVPFLHGRVLVPREVGALAYVYWLVQLLVVGGFFVFFWTRKGQTIGMLPWRLRLQRNDGSLLDLRTAILRVVLLCALWAPFFAGYWLIWGHWVNHTQRSLAMGLSSLPIVLAYAWIWVDPDSRAWHDRCTRTQMIVLPKR